MNTVVLYFDVIFNVSGILSFYSKCSPPSCLITGELCSNNDHFSLDCIFFIV